MFESTPIRSLNDGNVKLLSMSSSLKWGSCTQIVVNHRHYLRWKLQWIGPKSSHSVTVQLRFMANSKSSVPKTAKHETMTNFDIDDADDTDDIQVVADRVPEFDAKIQCQWRKTYFSVANIKWEKYYVSSPHITSSWLRMTTFKTMTMKQADDDNDDDQKKEEDLPVDLSFLSSIKTMESSSSSPITTLDHREVLYSSSHWNLSLSFSVARCLIAFCSFVRCRDSSK